MADERPFFFVKRKIVEWPPNTSSVITDKFLIEQGEFTSSIAISRDGETLAAGHMGRITLWDTRSHRHLMTFEGHSDQWVDSLVFSPDGKTLISGSRDGVVIAWGLPQFDAGLQSRQRR